MTTYAFNNLHEQKSVLIQLTHTSNEIQHEPNAHLANRIIKNGIKPNRIISTDASNISNDTST